MISRTLISDRKALLEQRHAVRLEQGAVLMATMPQDTLDTLVGQLAAEFGFGTYRGKHQTIGGHSATAVVRWMGKQGWDFDEAHRVLQAVGVNIAETTIRIQLAAGANGQRGKPARMTKEDAAVLTSLL